MGVIIPEKMNIYESNQHVTNISGTTFYSRSWQATTIEQFIQIVDLYIHWYNEKRIKISLGSLSPLEYRQSLGLMTQTSPSF